MFKDISERKYKIYITGNKNKVTVFSCLFSLSKIYYDKKIDNVDR